MNRSGSGRPRSGNDGQDNATNEAADAIPMPGSERTREPADSAHGPIETAHGPTRSAHEPADAAQGPIDAAQKPGSASHQAGCAHCPGDADPRQDQDNRPDGRRTRASLPEGLRFAFGTLTVIPVRVRRWDRAAAGAGMLCAPLVGAVAGALAASAGGVLLLLGAGPLAAAVASTAVPAALTRGLHLDGLADTADALGSAKPAPEALRIMKASDIGPFGVLTLLFVVLAQVAALHGLFQQGWRQGAVGAVTAAVAARLALTWGCCRGMPAARPEGLGQAVAGTVSPMAAAAATAVCLTALAVLPPVFPGGAAPGLSVLPAADMAGAADWMRAAGVLAGAVSVPLAAAVGLLAAWGMLRRCRRRFGGITGDVLGAAAETAATTALLTCVLM